MAHKRKDTLTAPPEWWKHLRPYNKRLVSKAERRAAASEITSEILSWRNMKTDYTQLTGNTVMLVVDGDVTCRMDRVRVLDATSAEALNNTCLKIVEERLLLGQYEDPDLLARVNEVLADNDGPEAYRLLAERSGLPGESCILTEIE